MKWKLLGLLMSIFLNTVTGSVFVLVLLIVVFGWCGCFVHLFVIIVNGAVVFYSQSGAMWW